MNSHQYYARGRLVDRAALQFKRNCDVRLNSWMSKVIVNSSKNVKSSEMERKIYKEQNFRLWSASNSGLVEARKRKYSAGNFTYASKLVMCVWVCRGLQSRQAGEREQCCRVAILLRLSVWKWLKFKCSKLDYLKICTVERFAVFFKNLYFQAAQIPTFFKFLYQSV